MIPKLTPITDAANYPIQPRHIDTCKHFFDSFGQMETEISARYIVRFFQAERENWGGEFTYAEINGFYPRGDGFTFNRLIPDGYIVRVESFDPTGRFDPRDRFAVTHEFVTKCWLSAPLLSCPAPEQPDQEDTQHVDGAAG